MFVSVFVFVWDVQLVERTGCIACATNQLYAISFNQGCISCGVLLSGTGARGVSSEHMENVEMFSENCALVWLSENRDLVSKLTFVDV